MHDPPTCPPPPSLLTSMHRHLPLSLLVLLQFSLSVWSAASLVPPSTFPTLSATSSGSSSSSSLSSTSSGSTSLSASSSASTTSSAQFPSLSGYLPCVSNCLADAISRVNCSSVIDVNCFCVQPNFPAELSSCVLANCPTEVGTSENLAQQFCNVASTSVSLTFISIPTSSSGSTSSSSSSTSTSPTSAATSNSAAILNMGSVQEGTVVALGMSMLGILLGAYVIH
ncbi:hypothetical protein GALMADRAFT_912712 [Galerina marginata CBS 339.88]|uniref:CFEM domain-containing protein n=1 Tax=Galerina marginata (strain CBS 339.88) TaxID=685588 RepID=A0A067SG04_GALM3|nr:hypothetical protein GALMADRAFT_912712 [Galerina marginata CBS 339.88]